MKRISASRFGIAGVLFFTLATIFGGLQFSEYSHLSQLISESYAIDTPYGIYLRYLGFIPAGIFIAAFSFLAIRALPKANITKLGFVGVGIFYGIGTVIVSLFPCDKGCNKELVDPSVSQLIHNLTGGLTYIVVPVCLIIIGIAARKWTNGKYMSVLGIVCGITCIVFVNLWSADLKSAFAGLYQRIVEGSILIWIMSCSYYLSTLQLRDSQAPIVLS